MVAANPQLDAVSELNQWDISSTWIRQTIGQLWHCAYEMWDNQNKKLHNAKSISCQKMKAAAVDVEIEKLYRWIGEIAAEDRWHFNTLLVVWLKWSLKMMVGMDQSTS